MGIKRIIFGPITEKAIDAYLDAMQTVSKVIPRRLRYLHEKEKTIARGVFLDTVPFSRAFVSDAIGDADTPFTIPMPGTPYFAMNVGPGHFDISMAESAKGRELLIHELVHVWQGIHSDWAWKYVFRSVWHQQKGSSRSGAYAYDQSALALQKAFWGDYNPEQQAQLVEDWFTKGMDEEDLRFRFVYENIRGFKSPTPTISSTPPPVRVRQQVTSNEPKPNVNFEERLLGLLSKRFNADDVAGYGARIRELEEVMSWMDAAKAKAMLVRLQLRKAGDKIALYFYVHLSTAERASLTRILKKAAGA